MDIGRDVEFHIQSRGFFDRLELLDLTLLQPHHHTPHPPQANVRKINPVFLALHYSPSPTLALLLNLTRALHNTNTTLTVLSRLHPVGDLRVVGRAP